MDPVYAPDPTGIIAPGVLHTWREVQYRLLEHGKLNYQECSDSLQYALEHLNTLQAQHFLTNCFEKMVDLLTQQNSTKQGQHERACMEGSLRASMNIHILMLKSQRFQFVPLLTRLIDKEQTYYAGLKVYAFLTPYPGDLRTRNLILQLFVESQGLDALIAYLQDPATPWLGAHYYIVLIQAVDELDFHVSDDIRNNLIDLVMQNMLDLSEEQLKKDTTDRLTSLVDLVRKLCNKSKDKFVNFWLAHTAKIMNSSSLPVRLFAWDQVHDLVKEATRERPYPLRYQVRNAGEPTVNGIYDGVFPLPPNEAPKYQMITSTGILLTLFRCTMRSKAKWWFISDADKTNPGNANDIDYYQHKSTPEQQYEPPCRGWVTCTNSNSPGKDPPPVLVRLEQYLPEGITRESLLVTKLAKWVMENNIIGQIFGQSGHREIVARSAKLLNLLAEEQALSKFHIDAIWNASTGQVETEYRDEIHTLLAALSVNLSSELFTHLIDLAKQRLRQDFQTIILFVEKLSREDRYLHSLAPESSDALLELLWEIYKTPEFAHAKCYGTVEDLLSSTLYYKPQTTAMQFVRECLVGLKNLSASSSPDEDKVSRLLGMCLFLLSQHVKGAVEYMRDAKIADVLFDELESFVSRAAAIGDSARDENWMREKLKQRLDLLRHYFTTSRSTKMTETQLQRLWNGLHSAVEREQLLDFLNRLKCELDLTTVLYIFTTFICCPDVDWSEQGYEAFQCFQTYYVEIHKYQRAQDVQASLGLETLWRLLLTIRVPEAATSAIDLLLDTYSKLSRDDPSASLQLLGTVFDNISYLPDSGRVTIEADIIRARRCAEILSLALLKAKALIEPAHVVRGRNSRIRISVSGRKIIQVPITYDNQKGRRIYDDKKISLLVHPLHTIANLKQMIAQQFHYRPDCITLSFSGSKSSLKGDSIPLNRHGVVDGSEVVALQLLSPIPLDYDMDQEEDRHIARMVSGNLKYIDSLFALLEAIDPENVDVSKLLWEFLMCVPTQPDLRLQIVHAARTETSTWNSIISSGFAYKSVYSLQIIDALLQPATELRMLDTDSDPTTFCEMFISSGGLEAVANLLLASNNEKRIMLMSVSLRILKFCLFESDLGSAKQLLAQIRISPESLLESIIVYATATCDQAAEIESTEDALHMIRQLIQDQSTIEIFVQNPSAQELIRRLLRSPVHKIRGEAAQLAELVGKTQPVVFNWLVDELSVSDQGTNKTITIEVFRALVMLMQEPPGPRREDLQALAGVVSKKLLHTPVSQSDSYHTLVYGCLSLLKQLICCDVSVIDNTEIGTNLVKRFISDFLFCLPTPDIRNKMPICHQGNTRQAAFSVMQEYVKHSQVALQDLLIELGDLTLNAISNFKRQWNLQLSRDTKPHSSRFVGLKNQGCTCYLNATLQQLFMAPRFRHAILNTPIPLIKRCTLWHVDGNQLVGQELMVETAGGQWHHARVLEYDEKKDVHEIKYTSMVTPDVAILRLREGRPGFETGKVKLLGTGSTEGVEDTSVKVLEQVQRAFCFLESSKKKHFDPKGFVESCKCLNLNFNVYHQNDASEFYDQLLDRLETAMKGTAQASELMQNCFGGTLVYQKIPTDCDTYQNSRKDCGHYSGTRVEPFMKVELIIRGKEKLEESLESFVSGELMDGDNKVMCDACGQKKATVRRTCFGTLPNLLILHLKRFDLDFQTFETIKLNNRLAFPTRLNMRPYTKVGMEYAERVTARDQASTGAKDGFELAYEEELVELDDSDFEYELYGVLVHSGIAQGGHYYSFIRDREYVDKWYRFDDEEVTSFNPDHIPAQCFGGTVSSNSVPHGMPHPIEEDRHANALMLFYEKVKARPVEQSLEDPDPSKSASFTPTPASASPMAYGQEIAQENANRKVETPSESDVADGYQAFQPEVDDSNLKHLLATYLLDNELHEFIRDLLGLLSEPVTSPRVRTLRWSPVSDAPLLCSQLLQFSVRFLLDIILHSRERTHTQEWVTVLQKSFDTFPHASLWFLHAVVCAEDEDNNWLHDFLLICSDTHSRKSFVQLLSYVTRSAASSAKVTRESVFENVAEQQTPMEQLKKIVKDSSPSHVVPRISLLISRLLDFLPSVHKYPRTSDDVFSMFRELAAIPSICQVLLQTESVARLACFILQSRIPDQLRSYYNFILPPRPAQGLEVLNSYTIALSVMEAIAALIGVPPRPKKTLIEDGSHELNPEARLVFTAIFDEFAPSGCMDFRDLLSYLEKSVSPPNKVTNPQIRNILSRFETTSDGRLTLEGFLCYYAELAQHYPYEVWQHLHLRGYGNDLQKHSPNTGVVSGVSDVVTDHDAGVGLQHVRSMEDKLHLSDTSMQCLVNGAMYEHIAEGMDYTLIVSIIKRVVWRNLDASIRLLRQFLSQIQMCSLDWLWQAHADMYFSVVRDLLLLEDEFTAERILEVFRGKFGLLTILYNRSTPTSTVRYSDLDMTYERDYLADPRSQVTERYTSLTRKACELPTVRAWVEGQAQDESHEMDVLRRYIRPPPRVLEEDDYRRMIVVVENAGNEIVDGHYRFTKMRNAVGMFTKHSDYQQPESELVHLYRAKMKTGEHYWYIGTLPDTGNDVDYYYCPIDSPPTPPRDGWVGVHANQEPPPSVTIVEVDSDVRVHVGGDRYSSDGDDIMGTADDDSLSNSFGTLNIEPGHLRHVSAGTAPRSPSPSPSDPDDFS